jgi:Lrp/AsnC family transcriptional regulator
MAKTDLDRIDRKILHELMRDATIPVAQLAERVGLSQTPCWKRVQKLEAVGIITGRVALVDPARIGLGLTVFVEIEAPDHSREWRAEFHLQLTRRLPCRNVTSKFSMEVIRDTTVWPIDTATA